MKNVQNLPQKTHPLTVLSQTYISQTDLSQTDLSQTDLSQTNLSRSFYCVLTGLPSPSPMPVIPNRGAVLVCREMPRVPPIIGFARIPR